MSEFQCFQVWMEQTADNHIFKFLKNKLSRCLFNSYICSASFYGKYLRRCANQSDRFRDSTDFETQLYLCNEAFKVWTLTPFNSSKTSLKIPHIYKLLAETCTQCQNISLEKIFCRNKKFNIPPVARLAHLSPTLLVLCLAGLPPLRPHRHLRPPP